MSVLLGILAAALLTAGAVWLQDVIVAFRSRRHHRVQDRAVSLWDRFL